MVEMVQADLAVEADEFDSLTVVLERLIEAGDVNSIERLLAEKVWMLDLGASSIRAVTNLEVTREGIDVAIDALARVLAM